MKINQTVIEIGLFILICSMIIFVHNTPVVYEIFDQFLFKRQHTIISGLTIIPFIFGVIMGGVFGRFLIYPKITIVTASFSFILIQFLYYQYFAEMPKDNIGFMAPIVMYIIECAFIYIGALIGTNLNISIFDSSRKR